MPHPNPRQRLHSLRAGDGPSIPADAPPEKWPSFGALEKHWSSFGAFARSELAKPTVSYQLLQDGSWRFVARDRNSRTDGRRSELVYDPTEDTITFSDPEVDSGWVLEDAFGGDPFEQRR